jgi:hypothetical protein
MSISYMFRYTCAIFRENTIPVLKNQLLLCSIEKDPPLIIFLQQLNKSSQLRMTCL